MNVLWFKKEDEDGFAHAFEEIFGTVSTSSVCSTATDLDCDEYVEKPKLKCATCRRRLGEKVYSLENEKPVEKVKVNLVNLVEPKVEKPKARVRRASTEASTPESRMHAARTRHEREIREAVQAGIPLWRVVRKGKTCNECGRDVPVGEMGNLDPKTLEVLQCRVCVKDEVRRPFK